MFKEFFRNRKEEISYLRENGEKPIEKAIFNDTVRKVFIDFVKLNKNKNITIIGGISLGAWTRSRSTDDIDILVLSEEDVDEIEKNISSKFKRNRKHCFEHRSLGVEIEIITPEVINQDLKLVREAIQNSKNDDVFGHPIKIVTPKYLIALKLARAVLKGNPKAKIDQGDIMELLKVYGKFDLTNLNLSKDKMDLYKSICDELT